MTTVGDVQQQIADGARPRLARVGDRIEHGEAIPANVVLLRDEDNDLWERRASGRFQCRTDSTGQELEALRGCWPVRVVEVDPEPDEPACFKCSRSSGRVVEVAAAKPPRFMHAYGSCESDGEVTERVANTFGLEWPRPESQSAAEVLDMPAERTLIGPPHAHQDRPCTDACYEPEPQPGSAHARLLRHVVREHVVDGTGSMTHAELETAHDAAHAESTPLVLTLPVVPDGAVALVGRLLDSEGDSGRDDRSGDYYHPDISDEALLLGEVLDREGSQGVTVEMAPPREPRVWEQLDPGTDDLKVVECLGMRYTRGSDSLWHGDRTSRTWLQLRAMGEVREVLDDGQ